MLYKQVYLSCLVEGTMSCVWITQLPSRP